MLLLLPVTLLSLSTEVLNGHSAASFFIFVFSAQTAHSEPLSLQAFVIVMSGSAVLPALYYCYWCAVFREAWHLLFLSVAVPSGSNKAKVVPTLENQIKTST